MNPKFEIIFLEQAIDFMAKIDPKSKKKVNYNIDKAKRIMAEYFAQKE